MTESSTRRRLLQYGVGMAGIGIAGCLRSASPDEGDSGTTDPGSESASGAGGDESGTAGEEDDNTAVEESSIDDTFLQFQADAANTGNAATAQASITEPTVWWQEEFDRVSVPPVFDGQILYILEKSGTVRALGSDGEQLWQSLVMGTLQLTAPPALTSEFVLFGCESHSNASNLYAFAREDGTLVWDYSLDVNADILSLPTIADGSVVVEDDEGSIRCLSLVDGTQRWHQSFAHEYAGRVSHPAIMNGTVYGVDEQGATMYALALADGEERWSQDVPNYVESPITVADGSAYVGNTDRNVASVSTADGAVDWERDISEFYKVAGNAIAYADGALFVPGGDSVHRVDSATGDVEWSFPTAASTNSPTVVDGTVYVTSEDGYLYAVNAETGDQQWRFDEHSRAGPIHLPPIIGRDAVFVLGEADDGAIAYAIKEAA